MPRRAVRSREVGLDGERTFQCPAGAGLKARRKAPKPLYACLTLYECLGGSFWGLFRLMCGPFGVLQPAVQKGESTEHAVHPRGVGWGGLQNT